LIARHEKNQVGLFGDFEMMKIIHTIGRDNGEASCRHLATLFWARNGHTLEWWSYSQFGF
jgi:hypothetical protein